MKLKIDTIKENNNNIKLNDPLLPLYHRVYSSLLQQINDEIYSFGLKLPSEIELCDKYNVSRVTVRRALLRLENEGMVSRRRGAGTFVTRPPKIWNVSAPISPLTEHNAREQSAYESECLGFSYIPTPATLNPSSRGYGPVVLKITRVLRLEKRPVHLQESYVPERYGSYIDRKTLKNEPIAEILKLAGIEIGKVELFVEAVIADDVQSHLLDVSVGAALLRAHQLYRAPDRTPVEFSTTVSRPDRFRYRFLSDEKERTLSPVAGLR